MADLAFVGPLPRVLVLVLDHLYFEGEPLTADPALELFVIEMVCRIVSVPAEQVPVLFVATIELAVAPCIRA